MAIEASRQLSDGSPVSGFQLRHVSIKRALVVPDTKEGIEVSLALTMVEEPSESRTWRRFQISSHNESTNEWTEHCTGFIAVENAMAEDTLGSNQGALVESQLWKEEHEHATETCTQSMNFSRAYDNLQSAGLQFGPLFRNLNSVRTSGSRLGSMTGVVMVPDIAQAMPKQYMHSHLIHPATMDSMVHMMIAAVLDFTGKNSLDTIRLPTYIHDMWISGDLSSAPSQRFVGHASVSIAPAEKFEGRIRISDAESRSRCLRMDGIELTPLETDLGESSERRLCTAIQWKPDVNFLDSITASELSSADENDHDANTYWVKRLQLATMLYVTDALADLDGLDPNSLNPHMRRFYDWMRHHQEKLYKDEIIHLTLKEFQDVSQDLPLKHSIFKEIADHSAEGAITARMGRNIVPVMRETTSALDLMFGQDGVMEEVYKEGLHLYNLPQHLHIHLSLLRHQRSELKILEIGGGTGSFTAEVFKVLAPEDDLRKGSIASYTFTDISSGFFEKAKQRFSSWSDIMTFQSLNIEKSPVDQGFQTGTYDMIFAGNVIHATANLHDALRNLRSLLRPGGQLIMQEGIRQDFLWYPLVFGQLPGWWLGDEAIRKWCPYIPASEWNVILSKSGFSGVDVEYPSSSDKDLSWQSIMVSTAVTEHKPIPSIVILCVCKEDPRSVIIGNHLQQKGALVTHVTPYELEQINWQDKICISTVDLEDRFVSNMDETIYTKIKGLLMECSNILWLVPSPEYDPFCTMSMGLLRTVRWERDADGSNILTLETPLPQNLVDESLATAVQKIVWHQFIDEYDVDRHAEYSLKDGIIHIGRLQEWEEANNYLSLLSSNVAPEMQRLGEIGRPVEFVSSASSDSHWATDSQFCTPIGGNEIEVAVRAVGLNSDPHAINPAAEASGTISNVGAAVKDLAVGDNVVFLSNDDRKGFLRAVARVSEEVAVKLPDNISFESAAALPLIYSAARYGLEDLAGLSEGETVLIHTGASALGQAAIQCAKLANAEIFTTVSTVEDRDFLVAEYGIPATHIFSNKDFSFVQAVMRLTKGDGVHVVLNTLTGEALRESLTCVAAFGCFIDISSRKSRVSNTVNLEALKRNVTITRVDIAAVAQHRPKLLRRLISEALKLYSEGRIGQVQPSTALDLSQIKDGMEHIRKKDRVGTTVFVFDSSTIIPVAPEICSPYRFDEGASYILAGGLGGLGRSLARWMASRGARNLIFLSRSGRITKAVGEMISDLEGVGCDVHIATCDVADASRLKAVVAECSASMPPIKGCIQGSMVLQVSFPFSRADENQLIGCQDGTFAGMSYEDWQIPLKPKVHGSWNLHEVLPPNLDFFVMLSSVAGIFGNRGQSNYAAGNTFQDALAAFRTSKGLNATSINLGSVSSVGWVAENRSSMRTHTATLFELLREEEVHATVEYLIDPRHNKNKNGSALPASQLVLGLPTAEMSRQNGIPPPTYLNYSLFTHLRTTATAKHTETSEKTTISVAALLAAASSYDSAVKVVSNGIIERLSSLLAVPVSELDAQRFSFGGIDSLVAMEFRSWIVKDLKAEVSLLDIMSAQNIRVLSEKISRTSRLVSESTS